MRDIDATQASLPDQALAAWQAYRAMHESKEAHFGYLSELDRKTELGAQRTLAENVRLESLLSHHDSCVTAFSNEMKALSSNHPAAQQALITLITEFNSALGTTTQRH